ncbi:MAG: hypothetical protein EAZ63_08050 [Runella slithyformis]|nr:MAG: hypothetical protein EAZ63_08050 [Runella slithyformis]
MAAANRTGGPAPTYLFLFIGYKKGAAFGKLICQKAAPNKPLPVKTQATMAVVCVFTGNSGRCLCLHRQQ